MLTAGWCIYPCLWNVPRPDTYMRVQSTLAIQSNTVNMHSSWICHRYQCLCSVAEASAMMLQEMNPLVKVSVQQGSVAAQDLSFVQAYQVRSSPVPFLHNLIIPARIGLICEPAKCATQSSWTLLSAHPKGSHQAILWRVATCSGQNMPRLADLLAGCAYCGSEPTQAATVGRSLLQAWSSLLFCGCKRDMCILVCQPASAHVCTSGEFHASAR